MKNSLNRKLRPYLIAGLILFSGYASLSQTPYILAVKRQVTEAALFKDYCDSVRRATDSLYRIAKIKSIEQDSLIKVQKGMISNLADQAKALEFVNGQEQQYSKSLEKQLKQEKKKSLVGGICAGVVIMLLAF